MKKIISYPNLVRDWLLANNRVDIDTLNTNKYRPIFFLALSIIAYCLYLAAMQPGWVFSGEMWAESATNYFPNASSSSIAVRFFSKDVGYIPLPQRILASIGDSLHLPARSIPYFYTWSAILITGGLIGAFCLKPFRALVKNDFLRLFAAVAVLMIADFETRTFINFTYFAAFFVAIITALAFVEKTQDVPWWTWVIPILMISKPATLSVLPAMILVALVSKTRFKLITCAAVFLCLVQVTSMFFDPVKTFVGVTIFSYPEKIQASIHYFIDYLGMFFTGNTSTAAKYSPAPYGFGVLIICLLITLKTRTRTSALILVGLSLLLFNTIVHCFALPAAFNTNMARLFNFKVERYIIVGYSGVVLFVTGLIASITETGLARRRPWIINTGPVIFLIWFFFAGWFTRAGTLNRAPEFPVINNSQWQVMADVIDSEQPVCVPVDPIDMMFVRGCQQLNPQVGGFQWPTNVAFESIPTKDSSSEVTLETPPSMKGNNLISLAIMLKPEAAHSVKLDAEAALKLKDGTYKYWSGFRQLPKSGGLVMLTGGGAIPIDKIQEVAFKFSTSVELGYSVPWHGYKHSPVVFWMGN